MLPFYKQWTANLNFTFGCLNWVKVLQWNGININVYCIQHPRISSLRDCNFATLILFHWQKESLFCWLNNHSKQKNKNKPLLTQTNEYDRFKYTYIHFVSICFCQIWPRHSATHHRLLLLFWLKVLFFAEDEGSRLSSLTPRSKHKCLYVICVSAERRSIVRLQLSQRKRKTTVPGRSACWLMSRLPYLFRATQRACPEYETK